MMHVFTLVALALSTVPVASQDSISASTLTSTSPDSTSSATILARDAQVYGASSVPAIYPTSTSTSTSPDSSSYSTTLAIPDPVYGASSVPVATPTLTSTSPSSSSSSTTLTIAAIVYGASSVQATTPTSTSTSPDYSSSSTTLAIADPVYGASSVQATTPTSTSTSRSSSSSSTTLTKAALVYGTSSVQATTPTSTSTSRSSSSSYFTTSSTAVVNGGSATTHSSSEATYGVNTSTASGAAPTNTARILEELSECTNIWEIINSNYDLVEDNAVGDADIAGLGVVSAFLASAIITWAGALVAYFKGWIDPLSTSILDERILASLKVKHFNHQSRKVKNGVRNVVLIFSDQQIVTGIAVLVSAYSQMKSISVYHYQVAIYLAWMSSNVHLITLTVLRGWLQKNKTLRRGRVICMLFLLILLVVALVPTVSKSWAWLTRSSGFAARHEGVPHCAASIPAKCFWGQTYRPAIDPDTMFSFAILGVTYLWKIGLLFESGEHFSRKWLRAKPQYFLENAVVQAAKNCYGSPTLWYRIVLGFYIFFVALADFAESFIASLWVLAISIFWGSIRVLTPRGQVPAKVYTAEKTMGFGQYLPLLLLILPLMAVGEIAFDADEKEEGEKEEEKGEEHPHTPTKAHMSPVPTPSDVFETRAVHTAGHNWKSRLTDTLSTRSRTYYENVALSDLDDVDTHTSTRPRRPSIFNSNSTINVADVEAHSPTRPTSVVTHSNHRHNLSNPSHIDNPDYDEAAQALTAAPDYLNVHRPSLPDRYASSQRSTDTTHLIHTPTVTQQSTAYTPGISSNDKQSILNRGTDHFRTLHVPPFSTYFSSGNIDPQRHAILYSSRFFKSLIVWFNIFIAATFATVVYISATASAYEPKGILDDGRKDNDYGLSANWKAVAFAVAGMAGVMGVWGLMGGLLSRLYK